MIRKLPFDFHALSGNLFRENHYYHTTDHTIYRAMFKRSYCEDYADYICVDEMGKLFRPNYVTDHFKLLLHQNGLRPIRFHDLRHPYVKPTTKEHQPKMTDALNSKIKPQ